MARFPFNPILGSCCRLAKAKSLARQGEAADSGAVFADAIGHARYFGAYFMELLAVRDRMVHLDRVAGKPASGGRAPDTGGTGDSIPASTLVELGEPLLAMGCPLDEFDQVLGVDPALALAEASKQVS